MLKTKIFPIIFFVCFSGLLIAQDQNFPSVKVSPTQEDYIPAGWYKAGVNSQDYLVGVDNTQSETGKTSAYVKSRVPKPQGFCTLMQEINADEFRGRRVRLTAYVRSQFVSGWAGLWMRVEDRSDRPLSFDNMEGRPVIGTSDWIPYSIVLEVPLNADKISFGISLHGKGQVWADDFKFETVGSDVPTTDILQKQNYKTKAGPENLGFEKN